MATTLSKFCAGGALWALLACGSARETSTQASGGVAGVTGGSAGAVGTSGGVPSSGAGGKSAGSAGMEAMSGAGTPPATGGVATAGGATAGGGTAAGAGGTTDAGGTQSGGAGNGGEGAGGGSSGAGNGGGGTSSSGGSSGSGGSGGSGGSPLNCPEPDTLWEAGACTDRLIGVALSAQHLGEAPYAERALQFNYVTAENEMKWDATEPSQGQFDFDLADQIVDFAEANGMAVKGHTLVWHDQLPAWVTSIDDADALREAMLDHIAGVMDYYRGRVIAWDVVNEVVETDGLLRDSIWSQLLGDTFIEDAFVAARAADPDVKLYYNDFGIEGANAKADAVYAMVADLKARGVPIDGVGMQMHTRTTDDTPSLPDFQANLERLLALGVEVVISEMDVRVCDGGTLEQQRARFHDIIEICLAHAGCNAITIWGITDRYSWLNERTNLTCVTIDPPRALLWDDDYGEKPAYGGVLDALLGR